MCDQHLLAEPLTVARRNDFGGNSGQIAIAGAIFRAQNEGHEAGPGIADGEAELPRQVVAERCRTDLRN